MQLHKTHKVLQWPFFPITGSMAEHTIRKKKILKSKILQIIMGLNALVCLRGTTLPLDWYDGRRGHNGQVFYSWLSYRQFKYARAFFKKRYHPYILISFKRGQKIAILINFWNKCQTIKLLWKPSQAYTSSSLRDLQINFFFSFSRDYVIDGKSWSLNSIVTNHV